MVVTPVHHGDYEWLMMAHDGESRQWLVMLNTSHFAFGQYTWQLTTS